MSNEKFKGNLDSVKGKVKSAAGEVSGDNSMKAKGALDKVSGAIQKGVGEVKDKVEKTINELKK